MKTSCKYYPDLGELFRSNDWNTWKWMLGYGMIVYNMRVYCIQIRKKLTSWLICLWLQCFCHCNLFLCSKPCPSLPLGNATHLHRIESQLSSVSRTQDERCREVIPGTGAVLNHEMDVYMGHWASTQWHHPRSRESPVYSLFSFTLFSVHVCPGQGPSFSLFFFLLNNNFTEIYFICHKIHPL